MSIQAEQRTLTVALIGNPNTGKSTLFSALAGVRQQVGNYPGVTVEKKVGRMVHGGRRFDLVDLPGTYSLAPRSPDELVAVDVLLGRQADLPPPDAVVCIVDASNIERNLYLVSQVLEMGLPTVVALNMRDVAADRGIAINVPRLRERLGVRVIEIQANRRRGLDELKVALASAAEEPACAPVSPFPEAFQAEVSRLQEQLQRDAPESAAKLPRYLAERLLLDSAGQLEGRLLAQANGDARGAIAAARARLKEAGLPVPAVEAMARYGWVGQVLEGVVTRPEKHQVTATDRIDRVLTHKVWGTLFFGVTMAVIFSTVFMVATAPMDWIDGLFAALAGWMESQLAEGALRSLLIDGVIGGVGGVLVFLPQIMFLFLFIAVLEDCGYMARAAYLMDKLMVRVGLSGKSFIPMLSSFACAIPGVMAARVIENRRDRLTTILVAPLMSCSARLPVYTVLIAAFIPDRSYLGGVLRLPGLTMFAMYSVGIVTAAVVALVLKRTVLRGPTPPFVMELPSYKWPSPWLVLYRMVDRGWAFVARAGTLILAVSIIVWALLYYPRLTDAAAAPLLAEQASLTAELDRLGATADQRPAIETRLAEIEHTLDGAQERQSYLGRMGRWIEPAVRPLGWDWRIGCAAIASFPAREVVIGTLGVIFNLGGDLDVENAEDKTKLMSALQAAVREGSQPPRPLFTVPVALSIMVFFALCAQCAATLAVIRRETNSWRWPAFTFIYMTGLAYLGALATYQIGTWISG
jgi:ferrous iron transport protein B